MIVEKRTYLIVPGKLPEYLALLEKEGMPLLDRHLGTCIGLYVTEVGELNEFTHLWAYRDAADREARRARLYADPDWPAFLNAATRLLQHQNNCLLRPVSFSPVPALK